MQMIGVDYMLEKGNIEALIQKEILTEEDVRILQNEEIDEEKALCLIKKRCL
jgi:hypothetical protein